MTPERAAGRAEALDEVARALGWPRWPLDGVERLLAIRQELREVLLALLDNRDFLGYQLSHAHGGLDDQALDQIAAHHLREVPISEEARRRRLRLLRDLVPDRLDTDVLSVVLRQDDEAARGLLGSESDEDIPQGIWARVRRLWRD